MTDLDDFWPPPTAPDPIPTPRKCRRHVWAVLDFAERCVRCAVLRDPIVSRRSRLNGKRGRSDELVVANILGGRKVGSLGMSHDVEVPGYLRAQCKKLDRMPSLNAVLSWLDAIPVGPELRAVTIADTPGPGGRTRRLIVMELAEFAQWHGRKP